MFITEFYLYEVKFKKGMFYILNRIYNKSLEDKYK